MLFLSLFSFASIVQLSFYRRAALWMHNWDLSENPCVKAPMTKDLHRIGRLLSLWIWGAGVAHKPYTIDWQECHTLCRNVVFWLPVMSHFSCYVLIQKTREINYWYTGPGDKLYMRYVFGMFLNSLSTQTCLVDCILGSTMLQDGVEETSSGGDHIGPLCNQICPTKSLLIFSAIFALDNCTGKWKLVQFYMEAHFCYCDEKKIV